MRSSQIRKLILLAVLVALIAIAGSVQIAGFIIEYNWWKEVEQVDAWLSMLWYEIAPAAAGMLIVFIVLWLAHARGLKYAGLRLRDLGLYSRLVPVALLVAAALLASASIDYWVVMRYAGSRHITLPAGPEGTPWRDPVFSRTLPFYLFDLPFYSDLLTFAFVLSILSIVVFWATARGWQEVQRFRSWRRSGGSAESFRLEPNVLMLPGATRSGFVRVIAIVLLLGFAGWIFLGNFELLFNSHAFMTGADFVDDNVSKVDFTKRPLTVWTSDGTYEARSVIVATGANAKYLGLPNEERLKGRGVSACSTCDGFFFKGLDVVVVGGGDTSMEDSLYLSKLCKTVTVVHRRDAFRASKIMQSRLFKAPNVKVIWNSEVVDVLGEVKVEGVRIKNVKTGKTSELKVHGLFLAIGHTPATEVFKDHLKFERGYIALQPRDGLSTATSVDGVFAAGDVHDFRYRQAVTAAGFGCMAALDAEKWLQAQA